MMIGAQGGTRPVLWQDWRDAREGNCQNHRYQVDTAPFIPALALIAPFRAEVAALAKEAAPVAQPGLSAEDRAAIMVPRNK